MKRALHLISGVILGLCPVLGLGVLAVVMFGSFPGWIGGILSAALLGLGIWIGVSIFKKVQIVGPFEMMTGLYSTSDLDDLVPSPGSGTELMSAQEYADRISKGRNKMLGGSLRIFGDRTAEANQGENYLSTASYSKVSRILTLTFSNGLLLKVHDPRHIFEASSFLKILKADRVSLDRSRSKAIGHKSHGVIRTYDVVNSKVVISAEVVEPHSRSMVSVSEPAVMILGEL